MDGSERYYYGVIDLFKKWGKKAAAELRLKITMYEDEASVAKPPDYARSSSPPPNTPQARASVDAHTLTMHALTHPRNYAPAAAVL